MSGELYMDSMACNKKSTYKIIAVILVNILLISLMVMFFPKVEIFFENQILEHIEDVGYTKYNISLDEMKMLNEAFDITIEQCVDEDMDKRYIYYQSNMYDIEKQHYKLAAGSNAQKGIDKLNELLFEKYERSDSEGIARDYGFNRDNPITLEWVLNNPQKLCRIMAVENTYYFELYYALKDSVWQNRYEE